MPALAIAPEFDLRNLPPLEEIEQALAVKSLHHFIEQLWRYAETEPFTTGWHIEAICDHLEAVTRGEIRRLIINIPPRHMKSLAVSVFWPAWTWLQNRGHFPLGGPSTRFLFASYAEALSIRDSVKCRNIIASPAFKNLMARQYPDPSFSLKDDQNTKKRFDNSMLGYRLATSVDGALTGEGGDIICIDDPHNVKDGESQAVRESTIQWWDEAMSTRLNNPKTGAYVIIMQRVHHQDMTGHILAKNHDWDHLCLPARYEGKDRVVSSLGFCDPRTRMQEPLWPARYGEEELKAIESTMGEYARAGQLQQNPTPREGGMFKVEKIARRTTVDKTQIAASIRYWDKAGTQGAGCFTAGVLMAKMKDGSYCILDVVRDQWEAGNRERLIKKTAEKDGSSVRVFVEQAPGEAGMESARYTIKNLAGYSAKAHRPTGDKEVRAEPYADQMAIGNVSMIEAPWNSEFVEEHRAFPKSTYKDQVDAASGAFVKLTRSGSGFLF